MNLNNYIFYAVIFIIGFIGTCYAIPLFKNLLINSNVVRPNYKNDMIPVSMGIVFLPMIIINGIILALFTAQYKNLLLSLIHI